ncbi:MAG TPA: hypothetical protein VHY75_08270 [Steroidobacteraceae bacterium]|jgi:hypothetical protein|nr:hypothetical protein [Steroidobacteraceae bacterium]
MNARHWIALAAACCMAGCASTGHAPATTRPEANASPQAGCVARTGDRLPDSDACRGPGNTYSQTDIRHTGRTTVAGALGDLDPALTIQHQH